MPTLQTAPLDIQNHKVINLQIPIKLFTFTSVWGTANILEILYAKDFIKIISYKKG